ncbi:MAG: VWA domain-containing protein [Psychroserpens sp.]|nr:VWA domain-containing protein [Psychroserpens sp.]MBO6632184.1 VWA domain-containing protein [Psychroserpens sp.]MBO6655012.1 VWA domain-containing protein [Psychroserpens sp.]MBO6682914.1 VWA domain-containing protein [Psychroserpens sp.]MBO6751219.1 VWA domain-containing protein [Psychroserpens sp.]
MKTMALIVALFSAMACNANEKKNLETIALLNPEAHEPSQRFIKVALLLDTSNSMDGLIDQAKAQLWDIVSELSFAKCENKKPNLQIALYEYGNDNLNSAEGYIRQVLGFSSDLDEISKQLFSLTTNGGNEFCGQVIQTSLNQLKWGDHKNDLKLIFIAGNEPFTQGKINYQDAAKQAHQNDVSVNTIFCGDYNQGISTYWKDGADRTHGNYMAIKHNDVTTYVATPYDDRILKLNQKLNKTYVAYGSMGKQKVIQQAQQDTNAMGYSEANAVSRTVSKSSHLYKNSSWDLVDAAESEDFEYDTLKKNELPKELKDKSPSQIKAYVEAKGKERSAIQTEIQQLNEKRRTYILSQQKQSSNGLENAMLTAIKSQASKKNYSW